MTQDLESLKAWIGKSESSIDHVTIPLVHRLAATLDRDDPMPKHGDVLPYGWHQMLFPRVARHSQLGTDGHPERGDFLPLFVNRPLTACGEPAADGKSAKLWVMNNESALALSATAEFK